MLSTIVIKCGGTAAVDVARVGADVAALARQGRGVLLTHGGSAEIERLAGRLGVPQRQLVAPDGVATRYTDDATLEVVTLALAGAVKPRLVAELARHGVPAVGLTGLDGGLLQARRKQAHRALVDGRLILVRDNHSGRVVKVNDQLLRGLLDAGLVPVVSPPALAEDGRPVNVDADRVAAAAAAALAATTLILLTGAPGVLRDPEDERSLMRECVVPIEGRPAAWACGGMALKLVAAREALLGGVSQVVIADGRREHPVRRALAGEGSAVVVERRETAVVA